MKKSLPKLIVAASEYDADALYATRFFAPDAFIFLEQEGRRTIVLSDLEIDRGRRDAQVDEVVALSEISERCSKKKESPFGEHIAVFLKSRKIKRVAVPGSFPLGLAHALAEHGITPLPQKGLFWAEREQKSERELKFLRQALSITETGMARGMEVLKAAEIGPKKILRWGAKALTSEILRAEIDSAILRVGGLPANTIVAGGEQACDPHERGHGPLRGHELIILDIFPRSATTGYYGDITRTVVRGQASDAQRALWETCLEGQKQALKAMEPGASGKAIQDGVRQLFTDRGYPTEQRDGRWCGFFHGLGHGLGLEIHEEPRIARTTFIPGQVVTVEPGLYYSGLGGVRHEDVVTITEKGIRLQSKFPKALEI
ncbi:MAG TPA: Xaa-Pro peptidase family protein [Chthoniobacteraceae bacterium]|jgi:Xaa-Pro aminopeptidase